MRNLLWSLIILTSSVYAQNNWVKEYHRPKQFIENKGQFDYLENISTGPIQYVADLGKTKICFGIKGIRYYFLDANEVPKEERMALQKALSERKTVEDHKKWEKLKGKFHFVSDEVSLQWKNGKMNNILAEQPSKDYHSYTFLNEKGEYENKNEIRSYQIIRYKNIYPNIDLVYTIHPQSGVKYSFELAKKADASKIKMWLDRPFELKEGEVYISTIFGNIIDHAPISFYNGPDRDKVRLIDSRYELLATNLIVFNLSEYDREQSIIIDPWTQTPSFATNWDCVWECDKDASGNVYVLGGIMPMQILKYNAAGALQWTYSTPYDTSNVWLGTFAVDNLGNSYVTAGSVAQIQKVNTSGAMVWNNPSPGGAFSNDEFWTITFNCDQSKLVVGGTGGSAFTLTATVYDINVNSGSILSSANFAQGNTMSIPPTVQEVRAICSSPNGKYYFMTHDTVGAFSQNFNLCSGSPLLYKINNSYNLGYKCENYRYDNSGICAIKANNNFYYTQNGSSVHKRNLQTGAIITTSAIPGGASTTSLGDFSVSNSGIDIDDCGNVYVGSSTGVVKYDANLNQLVTYPTSFKVYDVHVSTTGDIIAGGSTGNSSNATRTGYIQSFAASACAPLASNCCDATICPVPSLCESDNPVTLSTATAGGTWSGTGVNASGVFDPGVAGVGTFTLTYTLSCGSESTTIVVSPCQALTACLETNGSITVSGGVGPYTWAYYQPASNTPITNQTQCQACGYTWVFGQCLNGVTPVTSCSSPAQWVNFATGTNATPPGGSTQVQVTDNAGTVTVFTISNLLACNSNPCPTITVSNMTQTNVSCNGGANGTATVTASGGTTPYSYSWSPGNLTGATQSNLAAGTYTVTATDNANCTGTLTVTITQPTALQLSQGAITTASCGNTNGAASVIATGGTGPYSYLWTPSNGNTSTVTNIAGGNYSVQVTDANGCLQTLAITVPTSGGPTITSVIPTDPNCSNPSSGQIVIVASGTGALQYSLNGGTNQSSGTFTGLSSGNYNITVTDANGCVSTSTANLVSPQNFSITEGNIIASDCGASNGSADVIVQGGSGSFQYDWQPGGNSSANATNLAPGNYSVTVIDNNTGCQNSITIIVPANGGPSITSLNVTNLLCFGDSNGSVTVTATGGTAPYSYAIDGGTPQSASSFSNLSSGNYVMTVIDATNCPNSQAFSISEPNDLVANAGNDVQGCAGQTFNLNASCSGGTSPYDYLWFASQNSQTAQVQPTSTTSYNVQITDANGCIDSDILVVTIIPCGSLVIDVPNVFTPNGDGNNDTYGIISQNAISQEAIIVDRWGILMAELNSPNATWDGTSNGKDATDGVYFIKYRIVGPNDSEEIGHTFLHLIR